MTIDSRQRLTSSQVFLWKWQRRAKRLARLAASRLLAPRGSLPSGWETVLDEVTGERQWREYYVNRPRPWLWTDAEWRKIAHWITANRPDLWERSCADADLAVQRRVDILGHGRVQFPLREDFDWVTDPIAQRAWPMVRAERVPIILPDARSDIKHIWEIARFQFAPTLGAAYRMTGDDRFASALRGWIEDFIDHNAYGHGPHWTNPMEAAIRAVNWAVGWSLCAPSESWDETFVRRLVGSLIAHGRFIVANLETDHRGINTNHYIADLVGLYAIGALLPEWPESEHWREFAKNELLAESRIQILPDGFCYESSFGYHRLTFELWYFFWRLASQQGERGLGHLAAALIRMAEFSRWNAGPDDRLPHFGDGDDGRFLYWERRHPADHAHVGHLAEAAFGRIDRPAGLSPHGDISHDVLWLAGTDAFQRLESYGSCHDTATPAGRLRNASRLFEHAQIAVMRSRRWLVHAYANPVGTGGMGSHKHNDLLSFTASYDGIPFVIDPGTFAYTADPGLRNAFRHTSAHATVMIDAAEQNRFARGRLFFLWNDSTPVVTDFETSDKHDRIVMRHDGYRRLRGDVIVEREIQLEKVSESLTVRERLIGNGCHDVDVFLPLGDIDVRIEREKHVVLANRLEMSFDSPDEWRLAVVPGWRSESYGTRRAHRRLVFHARLALPAEWTLTLAPMQVPAMTRESYSATGQKPIRPAVLETPLAEEDHVGVMR